MHEGHPVYRVETSAHWDLQPNDESSLPRRDIVRSPSVSANDAVVAEDVRRTASMFERRLRHEEPEGLLADLLAWDRSLKQRALNPGTSADLTVATLMAVRLEEFLDRVYHGPEARACAGESAGAGLWPGFLSKP
jgi:hypothetical protein